jgi:hypothetical protein
MTLIGITGDFHYLWQCSKVIFLGTPAQHGSLSNMREQVIHHQVDKTVYVGDLVHAFRAHFLASICCILNLQSTSDIQHENSLHWLRSTAEDLVMQTLMPTSSEDPVFRMHQRFMPYSCMWIWELPHQIWEWVTYCEAEEDMGYQNLLEVNMLAICRLSKTHSIILQHITGQSTRRGKLAMASPLIRW